MTLVPADFERARRSLLAAFFAMGWSVAAAATRWAEIKVQMQTDDSAFGYALATGTLGALAGNTVANRLIRRFGAKTVALFGLVTMMTVVGTNGMLPSVAWLTVVSFTGACLYSTANIAVNAQGVDVEVHLRRSVMPSFHAAWSLGSLLSALTGNAVTGFTTPAQHLAGNAAIAIAITLVAGRGLLPVDPMPEVPHKKLPTSARKVLALSALVMSLGLIAEISALDWSAIHLHETLGVPIGPNGVGVTIFLLAQLTGRSVGGRLTDRYGSHNVVRWGALTAGLGYGGALWLAPQMAADWQLPVMLLGYAVLGLGVSGMPPAFMTAAGRTAGISTSRALSVMILINSMLMLVWRPLVSSSIGWFGTTTALLMTAFALLVASYLSKVLRPTPAL